MNTETTEETTALAEAHYFKFSTNWRGPDRLCADCRLPYADGNHIEIPPMKPYTSFVCPSEGGRGHSFRYTGDGSHPELRTLRDRFCACGLELVEEDNERWVLSWEMRSEGSDNWHQVEHIQSKHAATQQHAGLLELIAQGESIRNVQLTELRPVV